MNVAVYGASTVGVWVTHVWDKLYRSINRIGYARAAQELARLGYTEQAKFCRDEIKKIG